MAQPDFDIDDVEIRCPGGLLGIVKDGLLEVKCRHWACNKGDSITYHTIDIYAGKIVSTYQYKEPNKEKK